MKRLIGLSEQRNCREKMLNKKTIGATVVVDTHQRHSETQPTTPHDPSDQIDQNHRFRILMGIKKIIIKTILFNDITIWHEDYKNPIF